MRFTVMACGLVLIPAVLAIGATPPGEHQRVNQQSAVIAEFQKRVASYAKIHKAAADQLPALKSTASPEKIIELQHALANKIRTARPHAAPGNVFTPPIAAEFRRLIQITMHGHQADRIHASLQRGEPVKGNIEVNHPYPAVVPVETTPPSLLLNLPKLPAGLEYRVVAHELVLHDVDANLVVDFIPRAIP